MKSLKDAQKNVSMLKRAMGMRGEFKPGDLTMKARAIMSKPAKVAKKLPPVDTKRGTGVRGLI